MLRHSLLYLIAITYTIFADEYSKEERRYLEKLNCPPPPTSCKYINMDYRRNFFSEFVVNGKVIRFSYYNQKLYINCKLDIAIGDTSFPTFETNVFAPTLYISNCLPPKTTYADAIKKLNITFESLSMYFLTFDDRFTLKNEHFIGLDFLKEFSFVTNDFERDYFDIKILNSLPPNVSLVLTDLILSPFPAGNNFENVRIESGSPRHSSQFWGFCNNLRNLTISNYKVNILPEGWLSNCTRLKELRIENLQHIRELPERMLENAVSLHTLSIKDCKINKIPNDFFTYSKNLRVLTLSDNQIDLGAKDNHFNSLMNLETLEFTGNGLEPSDFVIFRPLKSVKNLNLENNYFAGVCQDYILRDTGDNFTTWPYLPSVVNLSLSSTVVHKPCPEWRKSMPSLKYLNISSSVEEYSLNFTFADLKLIRESGWNMDASDNIIDIIYNEADYNAAVSEVLYVSQAVLLLKSPIECNCKWYWFIKVLKERPDHISLPGFSCLQHWGDDIPKSLADLDPETIMCTLKENCPNDCECYQLAESGAVLVNCTDKDLDKIPGIKNLKEIVMPNNHLAILKSEDLPDSLQYLDLRDNLLAVIKGDVIQTLFSVPARKMKLSGNRILCQCENREFLEQLTIHKKQVLDFENITCIDGSIETSISNVDFQSLCARDTMTITLIILGCFIAFGILIGGIYYLNRSRIKSFLSKHGCGFVYEDQDVREVYDAFVSFSYEDTWFVADELMPVLEEENGFKLCVHTRDWMVGDWIPAQIARSVQDSRRTVIVLSKNFLSSIWALLEFRTAHLLALKDKRTRVIIILLEDLTSEVKMDEEIQKYLTTNTYVKWGEPNFWKKLCKALAYRDNERQIHEAGEEVAKLYKSNDQPKAIRVVAVQNELELKS